jgi:hypothetical protein
MNFALSLVDFDPLRAVLLREFRAASINRYFQVFAVLSLLGGLAVTFLSEDTNAIGFFVMQVALYVVSLFATLTGISSAQAERDEWPMMFSQPVARAVYAIGKFVSYFSIFAAVLLLLFLPAFLSGSISQGIAFLYLKTLLLAASFLALGLVAGFVAHDRAQAIVVGMSVWLLLVFGFDLIALFAARWEFVQKIPDLWVSFLMLNPLDSFRVDALFALEQIPAEAANKTPLATWWILHAGAWFGSIAAFWSVASLAAAAFRLNRWEE